MTWMQFEKESFIKDICKVMGRVGSNADNCGTERLKVLQVTGFNYSGMFCKCPLWPIPRHRRRLWGAARARAPSIIRMGAKPLFLPPQ